MTKRLFLFLIISLFYLCEAQYVATDLSYTCLDAGKYQVRLDIYTECGTNGSIISQNIYPLYISSKKLKTSIPEIYFDRASNSELLRLFCDNIADNCGTIGSPNRGLRVSTFYATIDLSTYPATDDWQAFFIRDFNDAVFTNMVLPEEYAHIASVTINTSLSPCNNSPTYTQSPIYKACNLKTDTLDLGISDMDQDELRFSLASPVTIIEKDTVPMAYKTGFSYTKPMSLSNNLKLTPDGKLIISGNKDRDVGATDLIIEEYRDGQKIGTTRRNIQLNVLTCENQKPTISLFVNPMNASKKNEITVCSGDSIPKFYSLINAKDLDNQIVKVDIEYSDPRMTSLQPFVVDGLKTGQVQIHAAQVPIFSTDKDVKITMSITVYDNGCPNRADDNETFIINVKAKPVFDFSYDHTFLSCNPPTVLKPSNITDFDTTDQVKPVNLTGSAPFTYQWMTWGIDNNGKHIITNPNIFSTSVDNYISDGTNQGITVKITDVAGCSASDSIYLENGLDFNIDIKDRCLSNDSTVFIDLSVSRDTNGAIVKRTWDFGDGTTFSAKDSVVKKKYCTEGVYPISLEIETAKGCKASFKDSLRIFSLPKPDFLVTTNCIATMSIEDLSYVLKPYKGGLNGFKGISYGVDYYASQVYAGVDTNITVHVQTTVNIKTVCDTIFVQFNSDSSALSCTQKDISTPITYKFNYLHPPQDTHDKIFSISQDVDHVLLSFKPFQFGLNTRDTILLNQSPINYSILKSDLLKRTNIQQMYLIQDQTTNVIKPCKSFVTKGNLQHDTLIHHLSNTPTGSNYLFPHFTFTWEKQNNRVQIDSGIYLIKQVIISDQCIAQVTKEVKVYAEPRIDIADKTRTILVSDTIIQNCTTLDTVLYAKINQNPNGGLQYGWELVLPDQTLTQMPATGWPDSISATQVGTYYLYVKDKMQCDDTTFVKIVSYLKADFDLIPSCDIANDTVIFQNRSIYDKGPKITTSRWFLQDVNGNTVDNFTDSSASFHKAVVANADVNVTLIVTDSLKCTKNLSKMIPHTNFKDTLQLTPIYTGASFCVADKIKARAIELIGNTNHIDSIVWNLGDGTKQIQYGNTNEELENFYISFKNDSLYEVSFKVYYNGVKRTITDSLGNPKDTILQPSCVYVSKTTKKVNIKPQFKGHLFKFRDCVTDTAEFIFEKDPSIGDSSIKVENVHWTVYTRSMLPEPNIQFPIQRDDAYSFKQKFENRQDLMIIFFAQDQNGCAFKDSTESSLVAMDMPIIVGMDSVCLGAESSIRLRYPNKPSQVIHKYGIDYLNVQVAENPYLSYNVTETVKYRFPYAGTLPIRAYAYYIYTGEKSILDDRVNECRAVIDTSIYVRPIPTVNFNANPVCARTDTTRFINLTSFKGTTKDPKDSIIVSYIWDFGDSTAKSNQVNPKHVYAKGGTKEVSLTAISANGCSASDTLPVASFFSPTAFFTTKDSSLLDFKDPIEFENKSTGYVKAHWDFGDDHVSDDFSTTTHRYNNIDRFQVTLTVTSDKGCPDTYVKIAELKPALLLPTAFSPNGDSQNDELFLIYRLIEELEEFKIYNRWGEVIFDAQSNLNARWDGKYKGTDQELGSYVAYVKARGKYGYSYNFKQNITLLR